jgi:serine/threonine protein kinase
MKCPKCGTLNTEDSQSCKKCATSLTGDAVALPSFTKTLETPSKGIVPGTTFAARYKVIEELGRGGMGVVYKAEDAKLKRTVAIKLLPPELTGHKEAKERFIREAQSAAVLDHPNICTIYEVEESEDKTFISMAYVDGQDLREMVKTGPLKVEEGLDLSIQTAEGLAAAHSKGIIHRDIKSSNIMVTKSGQAKIMDFGLAKFAGASLITREGVTMGTVAYMSPEQAQGKAADHRSDIWSLGVVLYEMLTGKLPFQGETEASFLYAIVHEEPQALKEAKADVPVEIQKIMSRTLRKKPEDRYQSAEMMAADLRRYQDQVKAEEAGLFNLRTLLRRLRRPKVAVPVVLVMAIIAAAAGWYFNRQAKIRWARQKLLPEVERLANTSWSDFADAFELAKEAEKYLSGDPKFSELMLKCTSRISIKTEPPGAKVYAKVYKNADDEWELLGVSPIEDLRVPITHYRLKMEKDGYETVYAVTATFRLGKTNQSGFEPIEIWRSLDKEGIVPQGMVRVGGEELSIGKFGDFFIDRYEVTNAQYKEFVESGGYREQKYWKHEFLKDGKVLSWDEAMTDFIDQTGRPGPATWIAGNYPEGQGNHSVSGVSWYEAAAYAEFVGKTLPSRYHWYLASHETAFLGNFRNFYTLLIPRSNFYDKGIVPVGSYPGMTKCGAYDMAGNVREWCWNKTQNGRTLMGGAWNDATYMFNVPTQSLSFDPSPKNGFRCALYPSPDAFPEKALEPRQLGKAPNLYEIEPVPDSIFQVYKEQFAYDETELNARVEQKKGKCRRLGSGEDHLRCCLRK